MKHTLLLCIFLFFPYTLLAEEETTSEPPTQLFVTADRNEVTLVNVGRSVDIVTKEEIENLQPRNITETIQTVSGVRAVDIGGPGSPGVTPIEIRGFRTGGTQILLNGIKLADPSSISGTYESFFSNLLVDDIEAIEILKGGTGVLYGSDGQGGAINLLLKKPVDGFTSNLNFEGGSWGTTKEHAALGYGDNDTGIILNASRLDSSGLDEHGDYGNTTISTNAFVEIIPNVLTVTPIFRSIATANDLDTNPSVGLAGEVIPNQDTERNHLQGESYLLANTIEGKLESVDIKNNIALLNTTRDFFFDFGGFESVSLFEGQLFKTDLQTTFRLEEINSDLTLGVEAEHQELDNTSDGLASFAQRDQYGYFIFNRTRLYEDRINITGGARLTHISDINDTNITLESSASFVCPVSKAKFHTSIAQGFRSPTLFESQGVILDFNTGLPAFVGNQTLNEEESLSWDLGVTKPFLNEKVLVDVTFFQIDSDETIIFDFANLTHLNGGGGKTQGIESSLTLLIADWLNVKAAYTNLDRAEALNGLRRQRTPRNWFSVSSTLSFEKAQLVSQLNFRDSQQLEFFGLPERANEDGATVFNSILSYAVTPGISAYVKGENIFDTEYTEAGFRMPRASVYGGFKVDFPNSL